MEKMKGLKTIYAVLLAFCCVSFVGVRGMSLETNEEEKRGKLVAGEYICNECFKANPEESFCDSQGKTAYKKTVNLQKEYKKISKNQECKFKGKLGVNLTFKYDKKSYVEVLPEDAENSKESSDWKIRDLTEINPLKNCCLVSNRYAIYKKAAVGVGDYLIDSHIDVFCSTQGDIFVDTELS